MIYLYRGTIWYRFQSGLWCGVGIRPPSINDKKSPIQERVNIFFRLYSFPSVVVICYITKIWFDMHLEILNQLTTTFTAASDQISLFIQISNSQSHLHEGLECWSHSNWNLSFNRNYYSMYWKESDSPFF